MDKEWYFVGLWLGDGAKDAVSITSADAETIQYLQNLAKKYNLRCNLQPTKSRAIEINLVFPISYSREVCKYSLQDTFICKYSSIKEAALNNNIKYASNISACCAGVTKYCGNFKWKYGEIIKYNPLKVLLDSLDIFNNKHIPKELYNEPPNNIKMFLAGLIDSDGTLNHQTISITQKSKDIILGVQKLCSKLKYKTRIVCFVIKGTEYYKLIIKGDLRDIPVLLKRKKPTKVSKIPNNMKEYYV